MFGPNGDILLEPDSTSSKDFAGDLCETLLQDAESAGEGLLDLEFVAQLCYELAFGVMSTWCHRGFGSLWDLYGTAVGKQSLKYLDQSGNLIKDLVKRRFEK
jgi:hypothetical protein